MTGPAIQLPLPPDERLQRFLDVYLPRIEETYSPVRVWLWGSHAYGTPDLWSDIDIVVVSDSFEGVGRIARMSRLVRELGIWRDALIGAVEPLCYTDAEFDRLMTRISIVREGIEKGRRLL